jgi:hypothetical protein
MAFLSHINAAPNLNRLHVVQGVMASLFGDWTMMREWAGVARPDPCGATTTSEQNEAGHRRAAHDQALAAAGLSAHWND